MAVLWTVTIVVWLLLWWYKSLKRIVRYKQWRIEYMPWLASIEDERVKFDPKWPEIPSG